MDLSEVKKIVEHIEHKLEGQPFVTAYIFERDNRKLYLTLTSRLLRIARKNRIWKSKEFLTAFKNAEYGFDTKHIRSLGGHDGVFLLDRHHRPKNQMMNKIFNRYLDRQGSGVEDVAKALSIRIDELQAVRVVSHHMRLLGVMKSGIKEDWIVLVDYDDSR